MSTPLRLAAFAAVLALIGAAAGGLGMATRGTEDAAPAAMEMGHDSTPADAARASGLSTRAAGFSFEPQQTRLSTGRSDFRFRIVGANGAPAHDFDLEGGVRLHLIVVRRDLTGYAHVHPRLQADGSWLVPLAFRDPGVYRAYADFEVNGRKTVLGHDLFVAGTMRPQPLAPPASSTIAGPYTVRLARSGTTFTFDIARHGAPAKLQDYVGMRGHLVALRDGDLSYSHVHPLDDNAPGRVAFDAHLAAGTYRLFLQFKVDGRVSTAPFTIEVRR